MSEAKSEVKKLELNLPEEVYNTFTSLVGEYGKFSGRAVTCEEVFIYLLHTTLSKAQDQAQAAKPKIITEV